MEESRSTGNKEKWKGTCVRDLGELGYDLLKRKYVSGSANEVLPRRSSSPLARPRQKQLSPSTPCGGNEDGVMDSEVSDLEAVHLGRCPHRINQTQREGECGLHHVYPHLYGMRTLDGASSDMAGSESRKVTA